MVELGARATRSRAYFDIYESLFQPSSEPLRPASGFLGFDRTREANLAGGERMLLRLEDGEGMPYPFYESVSLAFVIGEAALARFDLGELRVCASI